MNDILFGNNNKAVIKKLANRSFHSNKMRNVIVAIAIALTTFLFTAVLTIGMGASGTLEYSMAKLMGSSADALVQGLSEKQFQQLKENAMFEKVGCWIPVEIMTNTNRRVAEVDYADQNQLEIRMLTPRTGSAPQKANEVLVSAWSSSYVPRIQCACAVVSPPSVTKTICASSNAATTSPSSLRPV